MIVAIRKGVLSNFLLKLVALVLSTAVGVILARTLSPDGLGSYAFIMSIVTVLCIPVQGGCHTLLVREVAFNANKENWGGVKGIVWASIALACFISLTICLVVFLIYPYVLVDKDITQIIWLLMLIPLICLSTVRTGTLVGLGKVVAGNLPEQLVRPLSMLLLLLLFLLSGLEVDLEVALALSIFCAALAFLFGTYVFVVSCPKAYRDESPVFHFRKWACSLFPLTLFSGVTILNSEASLLLIGSLSDSSEVGYYRVAIQGASFISFGMMAINAVLGPYVVRLSSSGDMSDLQAVIAKWARFGFICALAVFLFFIFLGELVISFVFGKAYLPSYEMLLVLCIGHLISVGVGCVGLVLNMMGHEKETLKGIVLALVANLILGVLLIPKMGALGGAISFAISVAVLNLFLGWRAFSMTGLNTSIFARLR